MSRAFQPGRHFLQIPGPTTVPDRVLRATAAPIIDHRGPEFFRLAKDVLAGLQRIVQTAGPVVIYPSSGSLCGVEMGLIVATVPHKEGGAVAALAFLATRFETSNTIGPWLSAAGRARSTFP